LRFSRRVFMKKLLAIGGLFALSSGCFAKDFRCRFVWVDDRTQKVLKTPKPSQWHTGSAACFAMMDRLEVIGPQVQGPVDIGVQVDGDKKEKEKFYQEWKKRDQPKGPVQGVSFWSQWRAR
jgi:hypothetical protein